jgi:hypothetical protein
MTSSCISRLTSWRTTFSKSSNQIDEANPIPKQVQRVCRNTLPSHISIWLAAMPRDLRSHLLKLRHAFPFFAAALLSLTASAADSRTRPNIIFVLIDDLRWDEVDYPFVKIPNIQRIAREGVRFQNSFVTTPLCSPSRASYLTGQYAHKHGVTDNTDHSPLSYELITFPRLLHDAGYETAFLGKWHMGVDDNPRPGIDYWGERQGPRQLPRPGV